MTEKESEVKEHKTEENQDNQVDLDDQNPESRDTEQTLNDKAMEAYQQNEKVHDKYIRAIAELDNFKKRSYKDREDSIERAKSQLISELLPSIDVLKMGLDEARKQSESTVIEGMGMGLDQLITVLTDYGLNIIDPKGESFDPKFHEAVSYEPSDELEEGRIIKTIRIGYKFNDQLLRAAMVVTSSGKSKSDQKTTD